MNKQWNTKPLVSVLITLYNYESFVEEAILSVIEQTYNNWEMIIVDDCSTDNSFNKAQQVIFWQQNAIKKKITLLKNEKNLWLQKTTEKGLKKCKGEYIALLDSDDKRQKDKIEKQIDHLLQKQWDLSYHSMQIFDKNSEIQPSTTFDIFEITRNIDESVNEFVTKGNHCTTSWLMFASQFINKIIPFSQGCDQDHRISLVISNSNGTIIQYNWSKPLWFYRIHSKSLTGEIKKIKKLSTYILQKKSIKKRVIKQIIRNKTFYPDLKNLIQNNQNLLRIIDQKQKINNLYYEFVTSSSIKKKIGIIINSLIRWKFIQTAKLLYLR